MSVSELIREFAYLDRERLEDFLSPLVGGLPYEAKESTKQDDAAVETVVDAKLASLRRKGGQTHLSWEEIVRATPASLFNELVERLRALDAIQSLDGFDNKIWQPLETGEFVDLACEVEFSSLEKLFDTMRNMRPFLEMFSPDKLRDQSFSNMLKYMELIAERRDSFNVKLVPIGGPSKRHVFVAELNKNHVRKHKGGLSAQYRLLGRINRKLQPGANFELFSVLPSELTVDRSDLQRLVSTFRGMPPQLGRPPSMEDLRVPFPAMVVTAVALYR